MGEAVDPREDVDRDDGRRDVRRAAAGGEDVGGEDAGRDDAGEDEAAREVEIRYRRLPDREQVFRQARVADLDGFVVTLLEAAELKRAVVVDGRTVLEPGAPVVWFTYPGRWHDVGRFHLRDGTFTGVYANVLTPVVMEGDCWATTDLCLDVWRGADGRVEVLDEEELRQAEREGWVDADTAARARHEAATLAAAARRGEWPPAHVGDWTLERARVYGGRPPRAPAPPAPNP